MRKLFCFLLLMGFTACEKTPEPVVINYEKPIDGSWAWQVLADDDLPAEFNGALPNGIFILKTDETNELAGVTVVEVPVHKNQDGVDKIVITKPLKGRVQVLESGYRLTFTVEDETGDTRNKVTLTDDLITMQGRSEFESKRADVPSFGYNWEAVRVKLSDK